MSKIKVNELATATPTLNDTLLGSNATKEYACKVEDLASLMGGGTLIVECDEETLALDKTFGEIYNAFASGVHIVIWMSNSVYAAVIKVIKDIVTPGEEEYRVVSIMNPHLDSPTYYDFDATSDEDYPYHEA